ncbi:SusC/RagA family TonB-linked outer membrane protein [Wenyingzhuangia sp. chi5]|uniref:SusC/RagA family TonB-linked outer membrane protein n=1 Tax=Wenyingzhuangia gilva TaxID=3057677 RepID=A0ABT8VT72_9FLAO|nr:SusC/RagA family TonB-linked outer membrane protein [Wenyingzhuangia sp. chi5]MDO3695157.1 SusC/RagA family TonB-linked outer membrane protein [Wenyingzhuangia sp. chi5]
MFSQEKKLTLDYKDSPLDQVLESIEKQTSYRFLFNANKIDSKSKVTIIIETNDLDLVLSMLFMNSDIEYVIRKEQILLTKQSEKSLTFVTQEQRTVKGKVLNAQTKEPLMGVMVLVKGTRQGAITNEKGEFQYLLKGANIKNKVLVFSMLGMKSQETLVGNQSFFEVFLEAETDYLEEVVLTSSYGTKKIKEELVGSVTTLTSKDIQVEQTLESVDKMLEGQIAGVLIENTTGVGNPVKIHVRGQGSLTPLNNAVLGTSTQPLIIIDGVILAEEAAVDSEFFDGSGRFTEDLLNPLTQLSSESIESFTVLKDAAATSLYGADGANGVILITTKKGKRGKPKFNFSTQLGVSSAINRIKYLNGEQYHELRSEYLKNTTTNYTPTTYNGVDTDWFKLLNEQGFFNRTNFGVSGANQKISYRVNVGYSKIDEAQKGNETEQLNASVNLGYEVKKFSASLSLQPSYLQKTNPNIYYSFAFVPTINPYTEDGAFSEIGVTGMANPLAAIAQNKNVTKTYALLGSLNLNYQLSDDFSVSTLFGVSASDKEQDRYFSGANESGRSSGSFTLNGVTYPNWGRRVINERSNHKWNWHAQLSHQKNINNQHYFNSILGVELAADEANLAYQSGLGFVNYEQVNSVANAIRDDNPDTVVDESTNNQSYRSDINNNSRVSIFSQFNYNFKKRYFFLANLRRDESSVFGTDTSVAYNGGAGASWMLSNENFLTHVRWLDLLKLKVSYGTTGNSRIGSYRSKGLYNSSQNGYNGNKGATTSTAPNIALGWEKNTKFNTGIDVNIFQRLNLSVEYYYDAISDLITSRNIPSELGYSSMQLNASDMYNRGWELSALMKWIRQKDFKWMTSFNVSTVKNKVTKLTGLGSEYSTSERALAQKVGYSTTAIWGIKWVGIDPATGRDLLEKEGQVYDAVTYNRLLSEADWEPIGNSQAKAYGGFNNTFTFFNKLDVSVRGSYQFGGDALVQDELISKYNITSNRNLSINAYDYWRQQGDVVQQPVVTSNNPPLSNLIKYLYDASYIKINNINIKYNFNTNTLPFIKRLSAYVNVSNVGYWYLEKSQEGRNGIREFMFTYPQSRTFTVGVSAGF